MSASTSVLFKIPAIQYLVCTFLSAVTYVLAYTIYVDALVILSHNMRLSQEQEQEQEQEQGHEHEHAHEQEIKSIQDKQHQTDQQKLM